MRNLLLIAATTVLLAAPVSADCPCVPLTHLWTVKTCADWNCANTELLLANGIYRRPNDLDYINYVSNEAVQASLTDTITQKNLRLLQKMPQIPLANYAYHNNGDLTFTNMADAWGLGQTGFSNGAGSASRGRFPRKRDARPPRSRTWDTSGCCRVARRIR